MNTLEMSFGRPQHIIQTLIAKASRTPTPRDDNPETIIAFSNAVSNLVTTMETLESTGHMQNPQLIQDLVNKVPFHLRLEWGTLASMNYPTEPNLKDFSNWLSAKALAVSMISVQKIPEDNHDRQHNHHGRDRQHKREAVHVTSDPPEKRSRHINSSGCLYCTLTNHQITKCRKFLAISCDEKWNWVKSNKVCFNCLSKGHQLKLCPQKKPCGEGDC
jgi:hypothetical protein